MSKTIVYHVDIQFGDCDPAGIVFFPNYSRWMDAASSHYFVACGLPPWRSMAELPNCVGAPLLEIRMRFHASATYGERLVIHTHVEEWKNKVFVQVHQVTRGDDLVCEGWETRILCVLNGGKLQSTPVPDFVRAACTDGPGRLTLP